MELLGNIYKGVFPYLRGSVFCATRGAVAGYTAGLLCAAWPELQLKHTRKRGPFPKYATAIKKTYYIQNVAVHSEILISKYIQVQLIRKHK